MEYKEIPCFDCDGSGEIESTNPVCDKPASACCGGCYEVYECKTCDGTGTIAGEDDLTIDYMLMLEAYEKMTVGYRKTLQDFNVMIKSVSEDGLMEMELLLDHTHKLELDLIRDQLKRIAYHTEIIQDAIRNDYNDYE